MDLFRLKTFSLLKDSECDQLDDERTHALLSLIRSLLASTPQSPLSKSVKWGLGGALLLDGTSTSGT